MSHIKNATSAFSQFSTGFFSVIKSFRFILSTSGVKRYAILPLIVNIILFSIIVYFAFAWGIAELNLEEYAPSWSGDVGKWFFSAFKWLLGLVLIFCFCFFGFTTIGMVLASPFNDLLSEKVEHVVFEGDHKLQMTTQVWAKATLFSLIASIKIAAKQAVMMIITIPFILIPFVGFLPFFLVTAYFTGLGFYDICLARNLLNANERKLQLNNMGWQLFGLGVFIELLFMIPFVGMIVLPLGVVASTLLYCNKKKELAGNSDIR